MSPCQGYEVVLLNRSRGSVEVSKLICCSKLIMRLRVGMVLLSSTCIAIAPVLKCVIRTNL